MERYLVYIASKGFLSMLRSFLRVFPVIGRV